MISRAARIGLWWTAVAAAMFAQVAAATNLMHAELQENGAVTTLSLQFDSKPQARIFTLDRPLRAVVDLKDVRRIAGLKLPAGLGFE